ncbi:hypothetical protein FRC08_015122 [Ceratobasidium sp. 394]|nr:hypothetical protein FRC08_015122 [Ceratobasidium sp. 394]
MSQVLDAENGLMVDPILTRGAFHLLAAKYFMLASFVILVYDHILTFSDEVDRIWRREWTGATWLFALNRYLTELQFIVNLVCECVRLDIEYLAFLTRVGVKRFTTLPGRIE